MCQNSTYMDLMVSGLFGCERTKHFIQTAYRLLWNSQRAKWSGEVYQANGVGRLKFITGSTNASVYTAILDECLKPVIRDHFKEARHCIFQLHSAPCHTTKSVSGYFFHTRSFFQRRCSFLSDTYISKFEN